MAGEALEVIDVRLGPHHHLEGGDRLAAGGAVTRRPEQSVDHTQPYTPSCYSACAYIAIIQREQRKTNHCFHTLYHYPPTCAYS